MNNAAALLVLEAIILVCACLFLHQRNPNGFNRVVTDLHALIASAASSNPDGDDGTPTPPAPPDPAPAGDPTPTPTPPAAPVSPAAALVHAVSSVVAPVPTPVPNPTPESIASSAPASLSAASAWTPPTVMPSRPNWTWTTITGRTYTNVKVLSVEREGAMITFDGGTDRVPLAYLPPDIQKLFNYSP